MFSKETGPILSLSGNWCLPKTIGNRDAYPKLFHFQAVAEEYFTDTNSSPSISLPNSKCQSPQLGFLRKKEKPRWMLYFQHSTHFTEDTWARNLFLNTCTRVELTTTSRENEADTPILSFLMPSMWAWRSPHNSSLLSTGPSMHSWNWRPNLLYCMPKGGKRVVASHTNWAQTKHAHLHTVRLSTHGQQLVRPLR